MSICIIISIIYNHVCLYLSAYPCDGIHTIKKGYDSLEKLTGYISRIKKHYFRWHTTFNYARNLYTNPCRLLKINFSTGNAIAL